MTGNRGKFPYIMEFPNDGYSFEKWSWRKWKGNRLGSRTCKATWDPQNGIQEGLNFECWLLKTRINAILGLIWAVS